MSALGIKYLNFERENTHTLEGLLNVVFGIHTKKTPPREILSLM